VDELDVLKQVPLFSRMDDEELGGVRAIMTAHAYAPGQVILREGELGDAFHVVVSGRVQFMVHDAGGHELIVDEVGACGYFGELSMLTAEPRSVRAKAISAVRTLALNRDEFFAFLQQHPPAAIDVLTTLGQRLHRTDRLLRQSVSRNVNEVAAEKLTISQRIADTIAEFSGTVAFLMINVAWFGAWLLWNQPWVSNAEFDPFPFGLLTMIVSLEAIFLSIFVLISQNRQAAKDRIAAEIDHRVNTKAEIEIGLVLGRLDDLERSMHYNHHEQCALVRAVGGNDLGQPLPGRDG
jgi:CRP/FNR family transcriptional regulator, cyclic AMP receptor protein